MDDSDVWLYTIGVNLLGEILVERGAISVAELHTGLEASRREGRRLGSSLMGYGFIDEHSLLEALAHQHGVPFVSESMLRQLHGKMESGVLPPEMLRKLHAVPFRKVKDRIQVAMTDPADRKAIDRITTYTQLHVEPFVASDRTIKNALENLPEHEPEPQPDVAGRKDDETGRPESGWDRLWAPRLEPKAILKDRRTQKLAGPVLVASFPALEPVGGVRAQPAGTASHDEGLSLLMEHGTSVSEIGELLVRNVARRLDRVCVFSVHKGKLAGWLARGMPLDAADVRSFSVYADTPSVFSKLEGEDRYVGPIPDGPVNEQLAMILGDPRPAEVVIASVPVMGRVKGYLMGDLSGRLIPAAVVGEVVAAAQAAGNALGRLLAARRNS